MKDVNKLHADIMNIQCHIPTGFGIAEKLAYKEGHKYARHVAAELAITSGTKSDNKLKIPYEEIGLILNEVMDQAVKNGANSISMPNEYVAVAHFISSPEQYQL